MGGGHLAEQYGVHPMCPLQISRLNIFEDTSRRRLRHA